MTLPLSEDAGRSLLRLLNQSLNAQAAALPPSIDDAEPVGGALPRDFCKLWPEVKPTLYGIGTASTGLAGLVHPLGIAGPVLVALVAAGDAAFKIACRGEPRA